jgi:methylmalonyl-CoA mutase N-terminal domain/subunit
MSAHGVRETGINAIQEVAFTIATRNELIREMQKRGIDINVIGRQICLTFGSGIDLFEEVAKFRAARRIWARTMKEDFGATDPAAITLRFSVNGSGSYYTQQQPLVNIVRGTIECLAAILGGTTDIQNASFDEGLAIPTEESARLSIRTQQVLAYESGAGRVADPLGGSYYIEWLTSKIEQEVEQLVNDIEARGGWLAVLASGWVYEQSQKGLLETQKKISNEEKVVVGVNRFTIPPEEDYQPDPYAPDQAEVETYIAQFREFKRRRDNKRLEQALDALYRAASQTNDNLVPYVFEALEADATFAEIIGMLRMVDGLDYDWAGERQAPFHPKLSRQPSV